MIYILEKMIEKNKWEYEREGEKEFLIEYAKIMNEKYGKKYRIIKIEKVVV